MIKYLCAAAVVVASFAAAQAFAGTASGNYARGYGDRYYNGADQGYDARYQVFNRYCPDGSVIESWPSGSGVRCALPGGGYSYP